MRPARVLGVVPVLAVVAAAIPLAEAALCGRGCRAALVALAIAAPLGILARWRRCSGVIGALVTAAAIVANALTESMPGNGLLLVALVSLWWVRGGGGAFAAGALAALLWAEGGWPPTGPAGLLAFVLARDIGACTVPTRWSLTSTAAGFAAVAMVVSLTFDLGLSIDEPRTLQVHLDPLTTRAPRIALEAFLTVALLAHARGRTWSVPGVALGLPSLFLLIALEPALPMEIGRAHV